MNKLSESKKIDYSDDPITFEVNGRFLKELLQKTRKVSIAKNRMQIKSGGTIFVVSLEIAKKEE